MADDELRIAIPDRYHRLNIGSGAKTQANLTFLYVDLGAWPVDVSADIRALPFRNGTFAHVHCAHIIEHVKKAEALPTLIELRRVLAPAGILYIAAPDFTRARDVKSREWMRYTERGGVLKGWEHKWTCSVKRLRRLLLEAGFVPSWAPSMPSGWPPNTHQWPVDFEARFLCRRDDFPWPRSYPTGVVVTR